MAKHKYFVGFCSLRFNSAPPHVPYFGNMICYTEKKVESEKDIVLLKTELKKVLKNHEDIVLLSFQKLKK